MSDTQHYRFQSDQARRLARQVTDAAVREKLLEMAEEYADTIAGFAKLDSGE